MKNQGIRLSVLIAVVLSSFSLFIAVDLIWRGPHRFPVSPEWTVVDADAKRGRAAISKYGCGACHVIPGVRGARGRVGPQLNDFASQVYVAGQVTNIPENLVAWIQNPDDISPGTAMPDLGVTEADARDIAAYLYTLR